MSQITVEKTAEDSASKSLRVTVPVDRVREAEAKALKYYVQRARLPGFRQGKAPEAVVRKRFGDAIRQTVLEEVIRESWETAQSVESLKPITDPIHPEPQVRRGQPDRVRAAGRGAARRSSSSAPAGSGSTRRCTPVADTAVEEQLARLQEQKAAWMPVEGAKPSPGQMVRVEVAPLDESGAARRRTAVRPRAGRGIRPSPASRSGSWSSSRASRPTPR